MSRIRMVLLSLVAVMSVGAVVASSASAAIEFKWKVAGAELKTGESKVFTVNNDGKNFDLNGKLAGAIALLLSHEVSVEAGAKIIGGVPGTNTETVVFKGVTVDKPANCTESQNGVAGQVKTVPLKTEIVEGAKEGVGTNEADILFTPVTGPTFTTFKLEGASCTVPEVFPVTGSVLGLPLPLKTEVVQQNLVFEAATKEYRNHANEFKTAGLIFANAAATLSGLTLVLLESGQAFGPF
jgi:hypothetical protein